MRDVRLSVAPLLALASLSLFAIGCAQTPPPTSPGLPEGLRSPFTGYESAHYKDPSAWLCLPGREDACAADLTATEIQPDGSRVAVTDGPPRPEADKVDCFYVYPTVDLGLLPGNHDDFTDTDPMAKTTAAQAARLSEVCDVYVPLYRQVTLGTYLYGEEAREARLAVAFSDVADAFAHYLGQYNHGRKIVLVGHSQGAEMVVRLLRRFFEQDPELRARLLVAMAIGGAFDVPHGRLAGGTLPTIPLCSRPDEVGCVVAFRSYRAGSEVSPNRRLAPQPGNDLGCVNPAAIDDGSARRLFSRTYLPTSARLRGIDAITTPFVLYRGFYAGACVEGPGGYRYLAVSEAPGAGDSRQGPIDLEQLALNTSLGTHILDMQFPQGDLIDLVAKRVATLP